MTVPEKIEAVVLEIPKAIEIPTEQKKKPSEPQCQSATLELEEEYSELYERLKKKGKVL